MLPAACRPDSARPSGAVADSPAAALVAPAVDGRGVVDATQSAAPPRSAPLTAAHGAEIVALGVTSDGEAAASVDRLGGIRLWPALDGTREPVVIRGAAARAITVERDGDGFAIGTLDAAGGVHLIRASALGAVRTRTKLGDRAAVEIDSTSEGLLILRADQTVELVDTSAAPGATGVTLARLIPEAGTHISEILVRGRHVLALIEQDNRLYGRRIVLAGRGTPGDDGGVRWGATTPPLAGKLRHAALSPDGTRLAVTRQGRVHPALIDLATGAALPAELCVSRGWPADDGHEVSEILRRDLTPLPLGFLTDTDVLCMVTGSLRWWSLADGSGTINIGSIGVAALPMAMSPGGLVAGVGPNLVLVHPTGLRYLGYGVHNVEHAHVGTGGVLVVGRDQQALVLDAGLRERARIELGRMRLDWTDAVLLDDRHALIATRNRRVPGESYQLAVFDGITRTQRQVLPYDVREATLSYEPATGLLAVSDGPGAALVRFDPIHHAFGPAMRLASAISASRLVAIDPGLGTSLGTSAETRLDTSLGNGTGIAALAIDPVSDGVLVGEIDHDDVVPERPLHPRASYRVPGVLRAVDRAGRLYMRPADSDDVVIYTRGVAGARLPKAGELELRPSHDGTLIAAFASPRLVLFGADGSVRWDTAQWSVGEVGWLASGELVAQFPSALARIDLATGGLAERRCGLAFGASDQPLDDGRSEASLCEATASR